MIPQRVYERFPWPNLPRGVRKFMVNLDFGGRELVVEQIRNSKVETILEIGSFLGGSTIEWLNASKDVRVICVDPWSGNWAGSWLIKDLPQWTWEKPDQAMSKYLDSEDGLYFTCLANLYEYRERVIPIRAYSQDILEELSALGAEPDLVYLDADKKEGDLDECARLFPGAILTGDDYLWPGGDEFEPGTIPSYPIQEIVNKFASLNDMEVVHREQTWILNKKKENIESLSGITDSKSAASKKAEVIRTENSSPMFVESRTHAGSYLGDPIDIVVTPVEINDHHGTGPLIKRVMVARNRVFSIRSMNLIGFQDYGEWQVLLPQDTKVRSQCFRNVLSILQHAKINLVLTIPFREDDVITAIAIQSAFDTKLCTWIMDDQNIAVPNISDSLMAELLQRSSIRFATHPDLKLAYERKFNREFFNLPAVVPHQYIRTDTTSSQSRKTDSSQAVLLGSFWSQEWFDKTCQIFSKIKMKINWYGNNKSTWLDFDEKALKSAQIYAHGVISEDHLTQELRRHDFVIVPVSLLEDSESNVGVAFLSLPGRILFACATANIPILILGDKNTCAARFVRHFGLGEVASYSVDAVRAAITKLLDPDVQDAVRKNASKISEVLSDADICEWLCNSIDLQRPYDNRFESLFKDYKVENNINFT